MGRIIIRGIMAITVMGWWRGGNNRVGLVIMWWVDIVVIMAVTIMEAAIMSMLMMGPGRNSCEETKRKEEREWKRGK